MRTQIAQQIESKPSFRPYGALQDCLFLSLVVVLSFILYIQGLGFYSDDWSFLGPLSISKDQSFTGLVRSIYSPWVRMRPVQIFYIAGLYRVFGPHPLGFHLLNSAVLLSGIVLFYLVLRELGHHRMLTLAVPAVYALLPHYCTDRFWATSNCVVNLSMALYFLSLYADLRCLKVRLSRLWGWKLLSILSLLGSALAYEVFLPLFLFNQFLVWYRGRQIHGSVPDRHLSQAKLAVMLGSNLVALVAVVLFKAWTTVRLGDQSGFIWHMRWLLKQAIAVNYGDYGLRLPSVMAKILRDYPDGAILVVGGLVGLIIFGYLYRAGSRTKDELPGQTTMLSFIICGIIVFGLGYAIFLIVRNCQSSPTGIVNRVAIAAAIGVALSAVGAIGWVSRLLPSALLGKGLFCIIVSLLCASGFLINNTIASFWKAAFRQEQEVLADIHRQFPTLPAGSTLILDGVCPYVGPAIVFESSWDLAGALWMIYRDYTLRADVVTPNLKVKENGLCTLLYGSLETQYPYDQKLFIYHMGRKMVYPLPDANAARFYFQTFNPDHRGDCPPGMEGYGVPVFFSWEEFIKERGY